MIKRRYGDAAPLRNPPCRPRGLKGVAAFDQTRLKRAEQADPAAWIHGETVVEGARNGEAGEGAQPAPLDEILLPRHDDRVLPRGIGPKPGMLGGQISFYTTTRR